VSGATLDRTDGLTVDWGDWWFNVRPSNTEPRLRLNLEALTPAERDVHLRRSSHSSTAPPGTPPVPVPPHEGRAEVALDPLLLEILACPEDKGPLLYFADEDSLYNPAPAAALLRSGTTFPSC